MSIKNELVSEFESRKKDFENMKVDNKDYQKALNGLTELADRIIEIEKSELENETKNSQLENEKKDRLIRNIVEGVKVVGGLGFAAWAFVASMNFEKEGTLTTEGGRSALRQLLRFVK